MRATLALLAALLCTSAQAGWVRIDWAATPGATAILSGCIAQGLYDRPPIAIAGAKSGSVTIPGLPDSGKCYFTLNVGPQDEWIADFTALKFGQAPPGAAGFTIAWSPTPPASTWSKGFDFRQTAAFTADPTGSTYVVGDRYPTTRNGVTFGWESFVTGSVRDRTATLGVLGGINFLASGGVAEAVFRVDLPAPGRYRVRLAAGDAGNPNRAFFEIRDGSAVLRAQPEVGVSSGQFIDATGVVRASNWATTNQPLERDFATSIARLALKRPAGNASVIATLQLERVQ